MYRTPSLFILSLALGFAAAGGLRADDQSKPEAEADPASVTVTGVVASMRTAEITPDTEEISSLELQRVIPHGTQVRKGQAIAWFDTEDIDERIEKEQVELKLADLAMQTAEFAHVQFQAGQKLDREAARRTFKTAQQAFDNFNNVDRDEAIEAAEFSLKSAKESLENVQEELEQLQKMYEEDDLTEESEEIVLKRAKSAVEAATYRLRVAQTRHDRTLKQSIPAQADAAQEAFDRAELAHAKTLRELDDAKAKQQIELAKQRAELEKQRTKLETLKAERKALTLKAPFEGLLYHGELTRGRLSDKPSTLKAGASVTPDQVIYTLVSLDQLQVIADVDEQQLAKLHVGSQGKAVIAAIPDLEIASKIKQLDAIPMANKKFNCVLSLSLPKRNAAEQRSVVPGLSVTVTFEDVSKDKQNENE